MSEVSFPSFWEERYRSGRTGWDLGMSTPVFQRLAESGKFKPGKMLVICAGRGYDAHLFAKKGFHVTAVDFAEEAVKEMQSLTKSDISLEVMQADLFDLPAFFNEEFDYILFIYFLLTTHPLSILPDEVLGFFLFIVGH